MKNLTCLRLCFLLGFFGFLIPPGHGQIIGDNFPQLQPRNSRTLKIEDALATNCFEQMFIDGQGRMWLTTCGDAQRIRGLHLIQFDGHSGDLHPLNLHSGASVLFGGVVHDSLLLGIELTQSKLISYSIHTQTTEVFSPLDTAFVFYNIQLVHNRIFVLAIRDGKDFVLEFENGKFTIRKEFSESSSFIYLEYLIALIQRVVTIDHDLFFADDEHLIFRYNTENGQSDVYSIPDAAQVDGVQLINWSGQLMMVARIGSDLKVFKFIQGKFAEVNLLPPGWTHSMDYPGARFLDFIYADASGWLFLNCRDPKGNIKQLIRHSGGKFMDFSKIYMALGSEDYGLLVGHDFTREVYTLSGEVVLVEIAQDYAMKQAETFPSRAMIQWDSNHLLVLTDVTPVLVDVNHPEKGGIQASVPKKIHPSERNAILRDSLGDIWFVDTDTIERYQFANDHITRWPHPNKVDYLTIIQNKVIFLSKGGLYQVDVLQDAILELPLSGDVRKIDGYCNAMISQGRTIWIATSTGLWKVDLSSYQLEKIELKDYEGISLLSMIQDERGILWLGSESNGVIRYDPASGEIKSCNHEDGLTHNTVVGLLKDNDGFIWVNTFNGVDILTEEMEVLASFFEQDGLIHNEGNRWSNLKLADGRLVFGTLAGITIIDPKKALEKFRTNSVPLVYAKSISYYSKKSDNRIVKLNPDFTREQFRLPSDQRNIQLQVGISDYISGIESEFVYRIDKPGYEWTSVGNQSTLVLTNLPTGQYDILIRGRNFNRTWSSNTVHVSLDVAKPFYVEWWFYVLCSIPFLGFLMLWLWRSAKERLRLEGEVQKRTATIAQQADALRQLDQAKTRIYTNITHEFRTPLTVVKGTSELIEGNEDKKQIIRRNTDRLLNLVNQLLELSKLESGMLKVKMVQLDMTHLIRDIFESFTSIAEAKDIGMHFYAHQPQVLMDCDIEVVHRIVGNLLSNAIKFTPSGGNIYIDVQTETSKDQEWLQLTVRDTGVGIPEDKIDTVFNRFYQVDDTTTRAGEGTGIGLALTKELVEYLTGTIIVRSVPGEGSSFTIRLPITHEAAAEPDRDYQYTDMVSSAMATNIEWMDGHQNGPEDAPGILLVEDNPDVIHYLMNCLQGAYRVHAALDGIEGVEKALQLIPDLIISDVMMPGKDGIQLCAEIKADERTSHIPIILLTAKADIESRIEGLQRGADAYMAKPFEKAELLLVVRNLILSRQTLRERYLGETPVLPSDDPQIKAEDVFMNKLNLLIIEHLDDEDYGVITLCHAMNYGRSQMHNKVKALTGLSTSAYIQHKRMLQAKVFLSAGQMQVAEVAYAVGFRDPNYFSRVFRKEFGMTPTEFLNP